MVLALSIARDEVLARAFRRVADFHARLTNPGTYVKPEPVAAPQARLIPFDAVPPLVPADRPLPDLLEPDVLGKTKEGLARRFGADAGFALAAYAKSPEYALLQRLSNEGALSGARATMDLIVNAIRSGRLSLEPKPDSGWYDYQWYALETLVATERARESGKLQMTAAYKERLKNAFRTILAIQALGNIKHGRAYDRLIEVVHSADEWMRSRALESAVRLREDFLPIPLQVERMDAELLAAALDATWPVDERLEAAQAIERPKTKAEAHASILELTYVLEECHGYREEAIEKLGEIGPEAAAALPLLRRALEDPSERVREAARWALGRIEARDLQEGAK